MADYVRLNLEIMGRTYPMRVEADEEARLKDAARLVNEQMASIQNPKHPLNPESVAVLAALRIGYALIEAREKSAKDAQANKKIDDLLSLIDSAR